MFSVIDTFSLEASADDTKYTLDHEFQPRNTYKQQFETEIHDNFYSTMDSIRNKLYGALGGNQLKIISHILFYFFIFLEQKGSSVKHNIMSETSHKSFIQNMVRQLEDELDVKFEFEVTDPKVSNEILVLLHFMTVPKTYIDIVSHIVKDVVYYDIDKYSDNEIKVIKELIKVKDNDILCDPFNMYGILLLELNNNNMLYGYCMNETYELISKLNVYIYTNFYKKDAKHISIKQLHSLKENMDLVGYDIIVTKMPKEQNIKHAECCERVNKLKIRGTKCEPLYLQLLMTSLIKNGRCAVIVPKSLLIGNSSCHIETRKYLLENFKLKEIIEMNKTYIIYFENSGESTTQYLLKNGSYNKIDMPFFPLVGGSLLSRKPEEPVTKVINVNDLDTTTYNLLEINTSKKENYSSIREINKSMNIKSKNEYFERAKEHPQFIKNPKEYFNDCWKSWYDFLGLDNSLFPRTKADCLRACKEQGIVSWDDYKQKRDSSLPENPNELYEDFTNWDNEMGVVCDCIGCFEKDMIIEELKTKLKTIRDLIK